MGRRGPQPTPTELKLLHGSRRINRNEPRPPADRPSCPRWLAPAARAEWKRVSPLLQEMGLLAVTDLGSLAGYCASFAMFRSAEEAIARDGLVVTAPSGYSQPSPFIAIRNKSLLLMRQFASDFGLSPSSRSGISVPGKKPVDDMEQFLQRKAK